MQTNGFWCKQEIERSDLWGNDKCNSGGIKRRKRELPDTGRKRVRIYVSRSCVCTEDQD